MNPVAPGWSLGGFDDPRAATKDGRKYDPVAGLRFLGLYKHGNHVVFAANIHGTRVLESPSWLDYGATPVFVRTLNIGAAKSALRLRVAPDSVNVALRGAGMLAKEDGFWIAILPGGAQARLFISRVDAASLDTLAKALTTSPDLAPTYCYELKIADRTLHGTIHALAQNF